MIYMRYMRYKMISKVKFFFGGGFFNMNIEFKAGGIPGSREGSIGSHGWCFRGNAPGKSPGFHVGPGWNVGHLQNAMTAKYQSANAVNSVRKTVVSSATTGCTKCHFIWAETPKLPLFLGTLSRKTPAMYTTCVGFTLFFAERWCLWPRPSVCTHKHGAFYRMFLAFLHTFTAGFWSLPASMEFPPSPKEQLMLTSERNRIMRFGQLVNHGTEFPGTMKAYVGNIN